MFVFSGMTLIIYSQKLTASVTLDPPLPPGPGPGPGLLNGGGGLRPGGGRPPRGGGGLLPPPKPGSPGGGPPGGWPRRGGGGPLWQRATMTVRETRRHCRNIVRCTE